MEFGRVSLGEYKVQAQANTLFVLFFYQWRPQNGRENGYETDVDMIFVYF